MEKLLFDFSSFQIHSIDKIDFDLGTYFIVLHCNKKPPHLGVLVDGLFFSAKSTGKDMGVPFSQLKQVVLKKRIASLFIQFNSNLLLSEVQQYFESLPDNLDEGKTCLHPINELVLANEIHLHVGSFLQSIVNKNGVKQVFGLNLPDGYLGIPYYSPQEIKQRIDFLKNAKRKESIT